jgi:hypothetical protein
MSFVAGVIGLAVVYLTIMTLWTETPMYG